MQIIDAIILLMLGMGAAVGFARGFLKQTVQSLGGIIVLIASFLFMKPVAAFLIRIFPSFKFGGIFEGISSLNILVYEVIAFVVLLVIFGIILRILMSIASFIESFLNATIILAIPSKILGAVMGFIEAYVLVFIALFILTLPVFNFEIANQSKYKDKILEGTPIISSLCKKTVNSFEDIYAMRDELAKGADRLKLDQKVLKIMIDNNLISTSWADELYEEGKLNAK